MRAVRERLTDEGDALEITASREQLAERATMFAERVERGIARLHADAELAKDAAVREKRAGNTARAITQMKRYKRLVKKLALHERALREAEDDPTDTVQMLADAAALRAARVSVVKRMIPGVDEVEEKADENEELASELSAAVTALQRHTSSVAFEDVEVDDGDLIAELEALDDETPDPVADVMHDKLAHELATAPDPPLVGHTTGGHRPDGGAPVKTVNLHPRN